MVFIEITVDELVSGSLSGSGALAIDHVVNEQHSEGLADDCIPNPECNVIEVAGGIASE